MRDTLDHLAADSREWVGEIAIVLGPAAPESARGRGRRRGHRSPNRRGAGEGSTCQGDGSAHRGVERAGHAGRLRAGRRAERPRALTGRGCDWPWLAAALDPPVLCGRDPPTCRGLRVRASLARASGVREPRPSSGRGLRQRRRRSRRGLRHVRQQPGLLPAPGERRPVQVRLRARQLRRRGGQPRVPTGLRVRPRFALPRGNDDVLAGRLISRAARREHAGRRLRRRRARRHRVGERDRRAREFLRQRHRRSHDVHDPDSPAPTRPSAG